MKAVDYTLPDRFCSKCKQNRPVERFYIRPSGYFMGWCKDCRLQYAKDTYVPRPKKIRKPRNRDRDEWHFQQKVEWYNSLKSGPCSDCGGVFNPVAMHWDHLPQFQKLRSVSSLIRHSRAKIIEEIAKCELVCANCHAVRTSNRWKKEEECQD